MQDLDISFNAILNQKEQPPTLHVHGSALVFTEESELELVKADPQGINPQILLLNLNFTFHPGPMKGTQRQFYLNEMGGDVEKYTKVQIVSNQGDNLTRDVKVIG